MKTWDKWGLAMMLIVIFAVSLSSNTFIWWKSLAYSIFFFVGYFVFLENREKKIK